MTRPAPLGPSRLLALEPLLVVGVLVLCVAACVREIPVLHHKLDLIEPLLGASVVRADVVERFALRGRLEGEAEVLPPGSAAPVTRWQLQGGGGVVFEGSPRGRPFRLSLNPAVANDGIAAQVIWLCGRQRPPEGWTSPAAVVVDGLTLQQLPAVCRGAV